MNAEAHKGALSTRIDDAPPAGAVLGPGEVVAGYRIECVAGSGGMGVVYRASDPELPRTVALKLIAPQRAADPVLRELFVRESLTAAGIEHPNVIPIYRAGQDGDLLYIAMRFVDGASLAEVVEHDGPLPAGRAARIVARAADALDAAHARGLVHRDVKPANILIADPEGEEHVYLSDFGLTGRAAPGGGAPGRWAGTLAYLAPEQISGGALDARTDVYALGCVLFHALTGRPPFPGADEEATLAAHLADDPPRASALGPDVPPALDDVVARAMAKRPEDRFASAGELGRAALGARFDIALTFDEPDRTAAEAVASRLRERGLEPVLASGPGAAAAVSSSGGCAVLVGRAGLGAWARDPLAAATDLAGRDRAFRLVAVLLPGGPDPLDPTLAFLATRAWADLRGGVEEGVEDVLRAVREPRQALLGDTASAACPYRGLEPFAEEDAGLFFGRDPEIARAVERLRSGRFLAVIGPSGSGKSSLARAGVIPAVRRGAVAGGAGWRVLDLTPGPSPLAALAARAGSLPGAGAPAPADLGADTRALDAAVSHALDGRPGDDRVLILVDQLEEAFTLCADPADRHAFFGNLVYAGTIPGGRCVVLATMRADFYHRLADHPDMRALVASQQLALGPIDAAGLRQAIERPARGAGLELEPGLTRRILTDVADRPGTLPLLQHLLLELWQRRRGRMMTLEAYDASGGVEGSLARRANSTYEGLSPERRAVARRVLLRLTQPGEGTEDTRRRARLAELATAPGEAPEVEAVVATLAEARLLTTGRDEVSGEPVVDVTHEALIRGWPELRGWIDEDREALRLHRRLTDASAEWEAGGRDEAALYRGSRLALWEGRDLGDLNDTERAFLAASRDRAEAERAMRRRRVRIAIGGLAAGLAVVAAIAVFALVQREDAAGQRDVALSRQIAASATQQLGTDPELSLLLADEALESDRTAQADEALRQATRASLVREAYRTDAGRAWDAALTPDGDVAMAVADGTMRLWDPSSGSATVVRTGQTAVLGVDVSADGTIATAGEDGTVRLWNASGAALRVLKGHDGAVNSVAFAPDGAALVSAGTDGTIRVWTVAPRPPRVIDADGVGAVYDAKFSPDGDRIVSGGDDTVVKVWSASTGARVDALRGHLNPVYAVAFSPDGRRIASGSGDVTVRIWQPGGTARPRVLRAGQVLGSNAVAFSPDGRDLVSAGLDGVIRVWDVQGNPLVQIRGHVNRVLEARFTPDGRSIVSAGEDGSVRLWDWAHELPSAQVLNPGNLAYDGGSTFVEGGRRVLSIGADGSVSAWDARTPRLTPLAPGGLDKPYINTGAVARDGSRYALARADGAVIVRDVAAPPDPIVLEGHEGSVWSMDFSEDGATLITGGQDGTVRVWGIASGRAEVLEGHAGPVWAVDMAGDATAAASAGDDGTVRVWNLATDGSTVLKGHDGAVLSVGLSPDATRVVSGGSDRTVRLWDVAGGDARVLRGHLNSVYTAAFSADASRLITAADDGTRVWDAADATPVFEVPTATRETFRSSLSPDGRRIVVQTADGHLRAYTCETCGSLESVLSLAEGRTTRQLTPDERETFAVGG